MKTIEQHFADWEAHTFGFGYGTGEEHVLRVLKQFLAAIPDTSTYEYEKLEAAVTAPVAWLIINTLAHADKIEYGTSPRYGWLTASGKALAKFTAERSIDQLYELTNVDESYVHCYPDHCNCDGDDCRQHNPFWPKRLS